MAAVYALLAAVDAGFAAHNFGHGQPEVGAVQAVVAVFLLICAVKEA